MIQDIETLLQLAKRGTAKRVAVAAAEDEHVLKSIKNALDQGVATPLLIGHAGKITALCQKIELDVRRVTLIDHRGGAASSATLAVDLVRKGEADFLMKGFVATGQLLKAVLDKEEGLRTGRLLSHVAFFQSPYYHKMFCVTDAAMNIAPTLDEKAQIIRNAVEACHRLGIEKPKVAVAAAVETVNPNMEATVHADRLKTMNQEGEITGCIVDGPMAIDIAVDRQSALYKGIHSEVAGDCDVILVPDIEAGNMFYKALNFLGGAVSAGLVVGAAAPIVLTSRSDNEQSKLLSIALAACIEQNK